MVHCCQQVLFVFGFLIGGLPFLHDHIVVKNNHGGTLVVMSRVVDLMNNCSGCVKQLSVQQTD